MKQESINTEPKVNINLATKKQYEEVIADFHKNQMHAQINSLIKKKGMSFSEAEEVFYSVIEYLIKPETYQKYRSSNLDYLESEKGLNKIGFGKFVIQVIRTKVFNFFRSRKRKETAQMAYEANTHVKYFSDETKLEKRNFQGFKTKNEISIGLNKFSQDSTDMNFQKNLDLDPEQILIHAEEEKSTNPILGVIKNINYRNIININNKTQFAA